ncbi:MAG: hypothetical protein ACM3PT_13755 [Deltaproteobacteria bacterium]
MKTKFNLIKISGLIVFLILILLFAIKAGDVFRHKSGQELMQMINPDSLKNPEGISEQRITQITIVNGKKKVQETIIKMKGDSIIEKKVVEKEEDSIGDSPYKFEYRFGDGFDQDSLWSKSRDNFNFGFFPVDSLMKSFRFNFDSPSFDFNFDDSPENWPKGFSEPFDFEKRRNEMMPFGNDIDKMMEDMFKRYNFDFNEIPGWEGQNSPMNKKAPKSLSEIIRSNLLNDGFISDEDQKYKFEISEKGLKIDGKKQDQAIFDKYRKIIEDNTGVELGDEFSFNFSNNKKLETKAKKI